jgi:hypothetical protein
MSSGLCPICREYVNPSLSHNMRDNVRWHSSCWKAQVRIEELEAKLADIRQRIET